MKIFFYGILFYFISCSSPSEIQDFPTISDPFIAADFNHMYCRFGNQILQYIYMQTYARFFGLKLVITPWIGQKFFKDTPEQTIVVPSMNPQWPQYDGITDFIINRRLMETLGNANTTSREAWIQNAILWVMPINQLGWLSKFKNTIDEFLAIPSEHQRILQKIKHQRIGHQSVISLHLRQGDYYTSQKYMGHVYVFPMRSYASHLHHFKQDHPSVQVYLASEQVETILPLFHNFEPLSYHDFDLTEMRPIWGSQTPLFFDLWMMSQSEFLVTSNSTLSFAASLLNRNAQVMWRPVFKTQNFRRFNPWEEDALEEKPHYEATLVDSFDDDRALLLTWIDQNFVSSSK